MRRAALGLLVAAAAALPARADPLRFGLGADWLFGDRAAFQANLQTDLPLVAGAGRRSSFLLAATLRAGALFTTSPTQGAVPLDVGLRATIGRVYLEGLVGPWIFFSGDALRAHGAIGLGLLSRNVAVGLELGGLSGSSGLVGARLAFRI
jgi:hypothetical protein